MKNRYFIILRQTFKSLNWFETVLLLAILSLAVMSFFIKGDFGTNAIIAAVAAILGVFCVVLGAKGSLANWIFGVVEAFLHIYICFCTHIYGDMLQRLFYNLPMQFIGFYQWRKRGAESAPVKARRLSNMMRIVIALGCIVLIVGGGIILRQLNDPQPFKDAATTVLSIVAQALMSLAFMEQWVLWIITNVLSVTMWSILAYRGEPQAVSMAIMWCFYLLNSINGLRVWLRLSREDAN